MREKNNVIYELQQISKRIHDNHEELTMVGDGSFTSANNIMRLTMNEKHNIQHVAIDNPEFPMFYDGKENITGKYSSFHTTTNKTYKVINIIKKYNELLKGKCYSALYFLYCKDDETYTVIERKEVENLTENFGFEYNNEYLDNAEIGDEIPAGTIISASRSYDEFGNVGMGVNGRILYAVHPAVQDDAIIISESFAKRMVTNNVTSISIPISDNTILLNLYGDKNGNEYQGLPNIGDKITDGIIAATRTVKETRMFSDLRDSSLKTLNKQTDQIYYGLGEVIDIHIYCNNRNLKSNKVNKQIVQYYNDAKWFFSEVYRTCINIVNKNPHNKVDPDINRWLKKAKDYLDEQAEWSLNDNTFSNVMVEILIRNKEQINTARKITGRAGNKTVTSKIVPDSEMPYLVREVRVDEYGVKHPVGVRERIDLVTNPLAIINRTIPMPIFEGSITFILDKTRKYLATLDDLEEKEKICFDILETLNPDQGREMHKIYNSLSDRRKEKFMESCISLNPDGTLRTDKGMYVRWDPFSNEINLRDSIISLYEKYPNMLEYYHIFMPKPKWGRDIYIGQDAVGYQYMMMLKQSGEKGFSVRSAGAISDESLPEKSNSHKQGRSWASSKPLRFGEWKCIHAHVKII